MALFKKPLGKTGNGEEKSDSTGTVLRKEEAYPGSGRSILEIADRQEWTVKSCTVYKEGALIDGHCLVEKVFEGGMGYIYITRDKGQGIRFAIKQPKEEILAQRDFFTRVLKEADAWTQIGMHPHIAYCYFVKKIEDVPHIFIEYVDGGNLRQWIEDGQCIEEKVNLDLAIQFCQGMEFAHSKGMIHRDIKPENILMTEDGILKITDFGLVGGNVVLVKEGGMVQSSGTMLGTIMGSPDYMAPEQWHNPRQKSDKVPDGVWFDSDIFSFGICMWEMFLGRRPFDTSAGFDLPSPPDPSDFQEDISEQLKEILLRCVEPKRENRYRDFGSLREDLNGIYREKFDEDAPGYHLELPDTAADQLNNQGYSYYQLGNLEEAKNCFRKAIEIEKIHPQATYNLSLLEWREGAIDDVEVITRLTNCKSNPTNAEIVDELLAKIHMERFRPGAAKKILSPYAGKYEELFPEEPKGRMASLGIMKGHGDEVNSVAMSADGFEALSGSKDKTLKYWDLAARQCIGTMSGHTDNVTCVALSADGRLALSGSWDKTLKLWDTSTGQCTRTMVGHTQWVNTIALGSDSRLALSGSSDKTVKLWDLSTGQCIRTMPGHKLNVTSVAMTPDGRLGLSGSTDKTLKLWDLSTGQCIRTMSGHSWTVTSVSISSDGRLALSGSGSGDGTIKLWDLSAGQCVCTMVGHTQWVTSVAMSKDSRMAVSGSYDKTLKFWDLSTGKCITTLEGDIDWVLSVALSPDGRTALSGSKDKTVKRWYISFSEPRRSEPYLSSLKNYELKQQEKEIKKEEIKQVQQFLQEENNTRAFSLLHQVWESINFAEDQSISKLYSELIKKGKKAKILRCFQAMTLKGHNAWIKSAAMRADGRRALSAGKDLKLWDLSTGQCIRTIEEPGGISYSVTMSADGRRALSGNYDKNIRLWDLSTGQCIRTMKGHTDKVSSVVLGANDRLALSGSDDKTIKLWDISTGKCIRTMTGHTEGVSSVALRGDCRVGVSGSNHGIIKLWDLATGHCITTIEGHTVSIYSIALSTDGGLALSAGFQKLKLWDLSNNKCIKTLEGHNRSISSVALGSDGTIALSGDGYGGSTLKLWDLTTGQCIHTMEGHTNFINSVVLSPDSQYALSASEDKTLILWRLIWDLEFPDPVDWDEGVRPYLEVFLRKHKGKWNEDDFAKFLDELASWYGFGWVRPEGIRKELEKMTKEWKA